MKTRAWSTVLAVGLFASGCAFNRQMVLSEGVGPRPDAADTAIAKPSGTLVVYSSFEVTPASPEYDASAEIHAPYDVYTLDGQLVRHVQNDSGGTYDQRPDSVALPAGTYKLSAPAQEYGKVVVPVVVVAGQTTTVHLDGNERALKQNPGAQTVRLPDGQIVGWLAPQSPMSPGKR